MNWELNVIALHNYACLMTCEGISCQKNLREPIEVLAFR